MQSIPERLAQQQEATPSESDRAAAQRAFQQGEQLSNQGTPESLRQAIEKYAEALRLLKAMGDRQWEAATLNRIGLVYSSLGEHKQALNYFNQELSIWQTLGDRRWQAVALEGIGKAYQSLGEKQKALDCFNQALSLHRTVQNRQGEAATLTSLGEVYKSLGEKQKALDYYSQALPLWRALGDRQKESQALNYIGLLYYDLNDRQKALDYFNQALPLVRTLGERFGEAAILTSIGALYNDLGEKQKALEYLNQALLIRRAVEDRAGEAATLNNLARVYDSLGNKHKALEYYNQLLSFWRAAGDRTREAAGLNNIGLIYAHLGEMQKALEYLNQALQLRRSIRNRTGEAETLHNFGAIYNDLGEKQKALDYYNQALSLQRAIGNGSEEVATLNNLGGVYADLGEMQKALDYYNQALPLVRELGNRSGEARTLVSIGVVYAKLGENQRALDYYNQAISILRSVGDRFAEAATLKNIGRIYDDLGEKEKALEYLNQALSLLHSVGNPAGVAMTLNDIGGIYYDLGQYQKALDRLNQGLPLSQTVGDRAGIATILNNMGRVYNDLGEKQKALGYYNQALQLRRAVEDRDGEANTLYNIARLERSRGNFNEAMTQIKASIKIIESLRTKVVSPDLRSSYFATAQSTYSLYIDILMSLHQQNPNAGYDKTAFEVTERARARSLLDLLNEGRANIRQGVDPELREKERQLQQQLTARTQYQLELFKSQSTEEQKEAIRKEIADIQTQLQQVETQIRAKNPRYAALTQPQPLTLKEIQQQVVDTNTVLLAYWLGEERSYLWTITPTTVNTYVLPKRAEIETAAKQFSDFLIDPAKMRSTPKKAAAATAALSQMLLGPVAGELEQKRLVIVGDGALQYIPLGALSAPQASPTDEVKPLLVEHEIVNLPSASTLALIRRDIAQRQPAPKAVAVLADPVFSPNDPRVNGNSQGVTPAMLPQVEQIARGLGDRSAVALFARLPGTQQEAEKILELVPESDRFQAFDFAASRETATSAQLSQYRILHFATHGFFNTLHPELSGIVLSLVNRQGQPQNGLLMTPDIFNLNLPAELIVLSGCQTGLGKEIRGEGLVGLTRGLMYAGASRVMVSLWSVNDESTAELMSRFYHKMLQEKMPPAAALRAAQISMWQEKREPHSWAAFILQGEWK